VIPHVHQSLSTKRVLTCDYIGGDDYATFSAQASQADKNAAAQTIWRFMMRALMKHGLLYADPHPGNYRFLGGGKVAFLDFGCNKQLPTALVYGEKRYLLTQIDGDDDAFQRACVEVLGYDPTDTEAFPMYIEYTRLVTKPVTVDAPFTYTTEYAREMVAFLVRNTKKIVFKDESNLPHLPKPIHVPKDHLFMNRLQWGLASVLAGLDATANWHRIVLPWLRGDVEPIPE
jgi:predicted unusual protein kinase regulating ubiquinone biosynthesis (AarF/ABC1/UbiB family)